MAQGSGTYSGEVNLPRKPPKRGITMLPDNGYLVLAFKRNNPVCGLCIVMFAIQFAKRYDEI